MKAEAKDLARACSSAISSTLNAVSTSFGAMVSIGRPDYFARSGG